jgi:KaiC/GvpD/RAD55 family RecA-like ATPase
MLKRGFGRVTRDDLLGLPTELKKFLKLETYSLLIKGNSGTGKTTLSLTILRSLKETKNFFYISTRTSPKQLFDHYPWLPEFANATDDISQYINADEQITHPNFEDARLDEPESLFERITNELMDIKSPIIVIDSWDAIASLMDKESRINNERVLQTWRERAKAKIIFVTEGTDESPLDFMVDGVLELSNDIFEDSRIRKLLIRKLRGIGVENNTYLFSLKNNMVTFLDKYIPFRYSNLLANASNRIYKSTEDESIEVSLTSGYKDLDVSLRGDYGKGSIVIIETPKMLSHALPFLFIEKIIGKFVRKDGAILIRDYWILNHLNKRIKSGGDITPINDTRFQYLEFAPGTREDKEIPNLRRKPLSQSAVTLQDSPELNNTKHILNIMGMDELRKDMIGSDLTLYDLCKMMKSRFDLSFLTVEKEEDVSQFSSFADVYLKFAIISGTLVLRCVIPSEGFFGVNCSETRHELQLNRLF